MGNTQPYIGRFAPSPSGPLHLGSLMSATCSYLQAKSKQGKWLVRIEDIDTPRVVQGIADQQLKQLEHFGLYWDEQVIYQSQRLARYQQIIEQLKSKHKLYACECTRKQLKLQAQASNVGLIYPRTCISKKLNYADNAIRIKTSTDDIEFVDAVYGKQQANIQHLTSDWVIKRRDGIYAYHLAVVVDDAEQQISEVVRGVDILPLTPLHLDLQQILNYQSPSYLHHPLMIENENKLSKQNHACRVKDKNRIKTLNQILTALGQSKILDTDQLDTFWKSAISQWDQTKIPISNYEIKTN
ncbi:MAG: tRNA glutamyl-Q(34) synthetase GluQRS [Gammaproteobacteria bacterium]|nr:tRNA glutamyl-Q(34) synthetase GluQRS [Gammaproteobacteria bacterium]